MYFGSRVAFFVAHCLAKLSILVFTRRIFAGDIYKENIFFGVAYAINVIYGVLGVLLSSAGCRPEDTLTASVDAVCDANVRLRAILQSSQGANSVVDRSMDCNHCPGLPD